MLKPFQIIKHDSSTILYDADLVSAPTLQLFDRNYHTNAGNQQNNSDSQANSQANTETGLGRARVVYFSHQGVKMVLKHYYRGGLMASISKDRYLGLNVENTRAFKEFRLLAKMQSLGLPVPEAVAANAIKGFLSFQADLITREIENTKTLSDILSSETMAKEFWQNMGACIKRFHQHDIYHADLNARNILLTETGEVFLIDFDNSGFRVSSDTWKMSNLSRLKRSLLKFKKTVKTFNFDENDWSNFLMAYKQDVK